MKAKRVYIGHDWWRSKKRQNELRQENPDKYYRLIWNDEASPAPYVRKVWEIWETDEDPAS